MFRGQEDKEVRRKAQVRVRTEQTLQVGDQESDITEAM